MILLRQKLYNRNDVEFLKKLHQITNGFRRLPNIHQGTHPRDVYRLLDFSTDLYQYSKGKGKVNWDEFRTLAKHLGMPEETAKYGQHAIEKFTNPELLERYRSIRAHRLGFGKELAEARKLSDEIEKLYEKKEQMEQKYAAFYKKISRKSWSKISIKEREEAENLYNQMTKASEEIDKWERKNGRKYKKLQTFIKKKSTPPENPFNSTIIKRSSALQDKALEELQQLEPANQNPELTNKIKEAAKKEGIKIKMGDENNYDLVENTIETLGKTPTPASIGHEKGHKDFYDKQLRRYKLTRKTPDLEKLVKTAGAEGYVAPNPLSEIPQEVGATFMHFTSPIMRDATPLERARQEKQLGAAFKTYYHDTVGTVAHRINRIPRNYDFAYA